MKQCCTELPLFLFSLRHMVELVHDYTPDPWGGGVTILYSCSVDPRKLHAGVKYYIVHISSVCHTTLMV